MLADEVTHVKMGSDWLRKVTEKDPDRRARRRSSSSGWSTSSSASVAFRGETEESPIGLARRFRELAGFTDDEVDTISRMDHDALEERRLAVQRYREKVGAVSSGS